MTPYLQFHLTDAHINQIKKMNQRRDILKYIRDYGCEPTEEIAKSFYAATADELEHEKKVIYGRMYAAEIGENNKSDSDVPDEPSVEDPIPANPTNIIVINTTETSLSIQWDSVEAATSYHWVIFKEYEKLQEGDTTSTNIVILDLTEVTNYRFGVNAKNSNPKGSRMIYINVRTSGNASFLPKPPANLRIDILGKDAFRIRWDIVDEIFPLTFLGGCIEEEWFYTTSICNYTNSIELTDSEYSENVIFMDIRYLTNNTNYIFYIKARNALGESEPVYISVKTLNDLILDSPVIDYNLINNEFLFFLGLL